MSITSINDYQTILFDFDGVLAESMNVKTEAFIILFEEFGEKIVKKVVNHHIENGGISRYEKIRYYYSQFLNKLLSDEEVNAIAEKFSTLVVDKVVESESVKGVKDFLEKYFNHMDFYVVSGTPQKELELIIIKRDMQKYFKGIYGTPATKPEIIGKIIKENNYNKEKIIFIGDSLSDYNAANKVDIPFLGRVPKDEKSMFPKDTKIFENFHEII
jgi:HAD superfamily hydrolase (TIGR01549 family)